MDRFQQWIGRTKKDLANSTPRNPPKGHFQKWIDFTKQSSGNNNPGRTFEDHEKEVDDNYKRGKLSICSNSSNGHVPIIVSTADSREKAISMVRDLNSRSKKQNFWIEPEVNSY